MRAAKEPAPKISKHMPSIRDRRVPAMFFLEADLNPGNMKTAATQEMVMEAQKSKIGKSRTTCNILEKTAATPLRSGARKKAPDLGRSNVATGVHANRNRGIAMSSEIFHHSDKVRTTF
jgi:hypothetical protein